jgi:hypothetical protein
MDSGEIEAPASGKSGKSGGSFRARLDAARAKWPPEVRTKKKDVFEGYRQMVLPGRRFRYTWRSLKGKGFWLTASKMPVFYGKTLREATVAMLRSLPEYADCTVLD